MSLDRSNLRASKIMAIVAIGIFAMSGIIAGIDLMSKQAEPVVLVNQVGYLPAMEKIFLFQAGTPDQASNARFDVLCSNGTKVLQNQSMVYEGSIWGHYYASGNFTRVATNGTYTIVVHSGDFDCTSPGFVINPDAYNPVLERAVNFYYYQRCGFGPKEVIPGYVGHPPCHLDDGYWMDEAGGLHWKNMSGGWHDAGDYGKYMEVEYNTQYTVYALANTYEMCKTLFDKLPSLYDTTAPDIVDEAVWGARYLQKIIVTDLSGNARVLCNIFGRRNGEFNRFGYWSVPSSETDNIANTSDDRMAASIYTASGDTWSYHHEYGTSYANSTAALMVAASLARTAWIMKDFPYWNDQPYNYSNLVANATALHKSSIGMILNGTNYVNKSQNWYDLFTAIDCVTELARWANFTHDGVVWAKYASEGYALRSKLVGRMDTNTSAAWTNIHDIILGLYHYDVVMNGTPETDLASLVQRYANETLVPSVNNPGNIFHLFQARDWIQDPIGHWYYYAYYFQYWGRNWAIATGSAASMIAYKLTGNSTLKQAAANNVANWMLGRNPLDICQEESLGTYNLPMYHNRDANIPGNPRGALPGSVPNGIARAPPIDSNSWWRAPDVPWYDMRQPSPDDVQLPDFRSNELYITDNAGFLIGFATLMSFWS